MLVLLHGLCSGVGVVGADVGVGVGGVGVIDFFLGYLLQLIIKLRTPKTTQNQLLTMVAVWLFNPFSINVSTRGNAESLIAFLVLLALYWIFTDQIFLGSIGMLSFTALCIAHAQHILSTQQQ